MRPHFADWITIAVLGVPLLLTLTDYEYQHHLIVHSQNGLQCNSRTYS